MLFVRDLRFTCVSAEHDDLIGELQQRGVRKRRNVQRNGGKEAAKGQVSDLRAGDLGNDVA